MMHDDQDDNGKDDGQEDKKKGGNAPDPMKSDVGRTDDVPRETASA